jgi:hypothetical protein
MPNKTDLMNAVRSAEAKMQSLEAGRLAPPFSSVRARWLVAKNDVSKAKIALADWVMADDADKPEKDVRLTNIYDDN